MNTALLAVSAPGIGDLTFAADEWIAYAKEVLTAQFEQFAGQLTDLTPFTLCEVGMNPPAYLKKGDRLAWWTRISASGIEVGNRELPESECDYKIVADHSVLSNITRILYQGTDPTLVAEAQSRLQKLSRWQMHGEASDHPVLKVMLANLHDALAHRTLPRYTFMTPEWVSSARYFLTQRAHSDKYAPGLRDVTYTFSEEFTDTPEYAFPDGRHGGFWVRCDHGSITVGAGPLPADLEPADMLTKGSYTPVVPVGRTVNAAMTDEDLAEQKRYQREAFSPASNGGEAPVTQTQPAGRGPMPDALARVFAPLHDELSKRTSGELPSDFAEVKAQWRSPQSFDRDPDYDSAWLRFDKVDIYGNPRG